MSKRVTSMRASVWGRRMFIVPGKRSAVFSRLGPAKASAGKRVLKIRQIWSHQRRCFLAVSTRCAKANSMANADAAMAGAFSVPARNSSSWPPPWTRGVMTA